MGGKQTELETKIHCNRLCKWARKLLGIDKVSKTGNFPPKGMEKKRVGMDRSFKQSDKIRITNEETVLETDRRDIAYNISEQS